MDTLHFEPHSYHHPQGRRLFYDREARRIDEMNLSELEVFMLRGRRLQAQTLAGALRYLFARIGHLLRDEGRGGPHRPDCHRHA